jgi:hypothetical protein
VPESAAEDVNIEEDVNGVKKNEEDGKTGVAVGDK